MFLHWAPAAYIHACVIFQPMGLLTVVAFTGSPSTTHVIFQRFADYFMLLRSAAVPVPHDGMLITRSYLLYWPMGIC